MDLDQIEQGYNFAVEISKFEPILIIPVLVSVWLLSMVFEIRERFPEDKGWMLPVMCVSSSFIMQILTTSWSKTPLQEMVLGAFVLAGITSIGYDLVKNLWNRVEPKILKKFDNRVDEILGGGYER